MQSLYFSLKMPLWKKAALRGKLRIQVFILLQVTELQRFIIN